MKANHSIMGRDHSPLQSTLTAVQCKTATDMGYTHSDSTSPHPSPYKDGSHVTANTVLWLCSFQLVWISHQTGTQGQCSALSKSGRSGAAQEKLFPLLSGDTWQEGNFIQQLQTDL